MPPEQTAVSCPRLPHFLQVSSSHQQFFALLCWKFHKIDTFPHGTAPSIGCGDCSQLMVTKKLFNLILNDSPRQTMSCQSTDRQLLKISCPQGSCEEFRNLLDPVAPHFFARFFLRPTVLHTSLKHVASVSAEPLPQCGRSPCTMSRACALSHNCSCASSCVCCRHCTTTLSTHSVELDPRHTSPKLLLQSCPVTPFIGAAVRSLVDVAIQM